MATFYFLKSYFVKGHIFKCTFLSSSCAWEFPPDCLGTTFSPCCSSHPSSIQQNLNSWCGHPSLFITHRLVFFTVFYPHSAQIWCLAWNFYMRLQSDAFICRSSFILFFFYHFETVFKDRSNDFRCFEKSSSSSYQGAATDNSWNSFTTLNGWI